MTRWILDFVRLGVFCSLVLLTAHCVQGDETKDKEKEGKGQQTYGLKISIENGEIKVEQTGSRDLEELPELLSENIEKIVAQLGDGTAKIRVNAKAMMKDSDGNLKEMPVDAILKAIGGNIKIDTDVDVSRMSVDVDASTDEDGEGGHHEIRIKKVIKAELGDAADLLKRIHGLKVKVVSNGKQVTWTEGDVEDGDDEDNNEDHEVRVMVITEEHDDHPEATHRLGISVTGMAGVVVGNVGEDTAAEEAGLESNDIVISVNGERLAGVGQLIAKVNMAGESGEAMELLVVRDGEVMTLSARPHRVGNDGDEDEEEEEEDGDDGDKDDEDHDADDDRDDDRHVHGHHGRKAQAIHKAHVERAHQMAKAARAEAHQHIKAAERQRKEAMKHVERQMKKHAQVMEQHRARHVERGQSAIRELRDEVAELREIVNDLVESMEDREEG